MKPEAARTDPAGTNSASTSSGGTISDGYRALQAELHRTRADYGEASEDWAPLVARVVRANGVTSLLDYGAGKQRLGSALARLLPAPIEIRSYDPAIPEIAGPPAPAEMVACIDVLEHVEPSCLDTVLDDLARLALKVGFFTITAAPARKTLPDGRNAHLIQEGPPWWRPRLEARFTVLRLNDFRHSFWVLVVPRPG
jgi:hypothetical protein